MKKGIVNQIFGTWEELESQRFGFMSLSLIAQSCIGSIAAFFIFSLGLHEYTFQFALILIFTLGANVMAIAQLSMKWVLYSFIVSIFVSSIFIIYGLMQ